MEFVIAFFLARYLRLSIRDTEAFEKWDKPFKVAMVIIAVLFFVQIPGQMNAVLKWFGHGAMISLLIITFTEQAFSKSKLLILSLLPLVAISFLGDLTRILFPPVFETIGMYLKIAKGFAFLWLVVTFILFRRQVKALEKERKIREKEAEEYRISALRKAELEIMVQERTREITEQKEALEHALEELKATQVQLVHAEKMASLGELTAGIAHEIQNPLNFVNNFSELNAELIDELLLDLKEGSVQDVRELALSIKENEQKIVHHGKRAEGIVRSMLQHSRSGTGQKEPADINQLADECIRLSYHGMRAKEKSFNAAMETKFATEIGLVPIIQQEIGRVLLNICTNGFYALLQRTKQNEVGYKPTLRLTTSQVDGFAEIRIHDNGPGIPDDALAKIFQPFFTTKPTGEGTGLGLSMSYEIITKGHGGKLKVETEEGEGTTFIIELPLEAKGVNSIN